MTTLHCTYTYLFHTDTHTQCYLASLVFQLLIMHLYLYLLEHHSSTVADGSSSTQPAFNSCKAPAYCTTAGTFGLFRFH